MTSRGHRLDPLVAGAAAAWCALWLVVGAWTGYQLWQLADLGGAVADAGRSLGDVGTALQGLGDAPLVGKRTEELSAQVQRGSADVVAQAQGAQAALRQLAVLLGLTVALLPSTSVLLLVAVSRRRGAPSATGG